MSCLGGENTASLVANYGFCIQLQRGCLRGPIGTKPESPTITCGQYHSFCQCKFVGDLCEDSDRKGSEEGLPSSKKLYRRETQAGGRKRKTGTPADESLTQERCYGNEGRFPEAT
ncbi:hypothetical protein NDU88_004026 [Pleurodeles waltl]|uniref:Uncharacterized protein n=1 Tax=Pleurodeles waltl TaxID=8319 RepID=A0AAV7VI27_PLEWA|nr:hypothetical protein NDU88_004026 [Pleurodeles waltl]